MNPNTPKKVFIKENDKYIEITYAQFSKDQYYENRLFILLYGMLLEVTKTDYDEYYRGLHRQAYLDARSFRHRDISYNSFDSEDFNGEDFLVDEMTDVSEQVVLSIMIDKLYKILSDLEDHERTLINMYFFDEISQTDIAKLYGVNQSNISRRILKILKKIKGMMESQ